MNVSGRVDKTKLFKSLERLKSRSKHRLSEKHPRAVGYLQLKGIEAGKIRQHATRLLASGALATSLVLLPPPSAVMKEIASAVESTLPVENLRSKLREELSFLPDQPRRLTEGEERRLTAVFRQYLGINAVAQLEGNRLNQSFGYIGAEQHLPRFPGDSAGMHDEAVMAGITPGLGAWGYFAPSRSALTNEQIKQEKYYVAVQTLYLPDWNARFRYLRDWYKYRKVVVVNPENGLAVAAVVADAGPADWTGKHFGGSPEVMAELHLNVGKQKGAVVLFFVDDQNNEVPLGLLAYDWAQMMETK